MKIDGENITWEDGDVVIIRFTRKRKPNDHDGEMLSDPYTYVRENGRWPGEGGYWSDHEDWEMTKAWHEFRAEVMTMVSGPHGIRVATNDRIEELERKLRVVKVFVDEAMRVLS